MSFGTSLSLSFNNLKAKKGRTILTAFAGSIGIITHISVMERTKVIGILRAMGASKANISQVFNAETFLIGLLSGVLGIVVSMLLTIPVNSVIGRLTGDVEVKASLPVSSAVILIILSMAITVTAGLIPARKAAKKDPVAALRSE